MLAAIYHMILCKTHLKIYISFSLSVVGLLCGKGCFISPFFSKAPNRMAAGY